MAKQTKTFEQYTAGTPFEGKTEDQVKNALYSKALQDLRNRYFDEFVGLVTEAYAAYGLEYKRRLTEEEKAEQQVAALLAANPGLAAKFGAAPVGVDTYGEDVEPEVDDLPEV